MNGDISRIPIQTLGAVVSLTDILPELPLPAPLQSGPSSKTLLWDPQLTDSTRKYLNSQNSGLTTALSDALENTTTDNIDFKDGLSSDSIDLNGLPGLLTSVLVHNYAVLQNKRGFLGLSSFNLKSSLDHVEPLKINTTAWTNQTCVEPRDSLSGYDERSFSPTKKKKKRKKKKHKHRDPEVSGGGGDTSETGGESGATTPATYDGTTPSRKCDEFGLSPTPTYGVVADTNKLSLKIFKRPIAETACNTHEAPPSFEVAKKEKKKKRSKERDREHKFRHERRSHTSSIHPETTPTLDPTNGSFAVTVSDITTSVCPTSVTTSCLSNETDSRVEMPPTVNQLPSNFEPATQTAQTSADISLIGNDSLFEQLSSGQMSYKQPQSQSTSSLPSTPASTAGASRPHTCNTTYPVSTSMSDNFCPTLSNHVFPPQTTLFDGILNDMDPSLSFADPTGIVSDDLMSVTRNGPVSTSISNTLSGAVCNIMDYASHILQNEMLSTSLCDSFPAVSDDQSVSRSSAGPLQSPPHSFNTSFMIASQLADSLPRSMHQAVNESDFNLPGGILNSTNFVSNPPISPSAAFVNSFDIAGLTSEPMGTHHVPMGLASYLAGPGQSTVQIPQPQARRSNIRTESGDRSASTNNPQALWKRKAAAPLRRRRRRKNEVEDLQQWTVNYPTGTVASGKSAEKAIEERTWDDAIGSHSQALGERVKRRKRLARETGNFDPDFVFQHDKEYHNGGESDAAPDIEPGTVDLTNDLDSAQCIPSRGLRGAAQRSYAGMDDDDEGPGGDSASGTEGSRRRRKVDDDEPFEVRLKEPVEMRFPHLMRKSSEPIRRRRERVGFGTIPVGETPTKRHHTTPMTVFSAEAGSLKRFLQRLQAVLDSVEDCDLLSTVNTVGTSGEGNGSGKLTVAERASRAGFTDDSEAFVAPEELAELCRDAAKLNATRVANQIPTDQLLKFMTLLLFNVRDGASVIATLRPDEKADEHENKLWRELAMERVMRSVNAGLTALLLMTANDMPREVYVEDVIERTIQTVRFQLINCIYPEFDAAYRVENSAKENQSSIKSRRARERDVHKPRAIIQLYHKLVELVLNLAKLVKMQRLTDGLILALSSIGVSAFFVENVSELQLAALELVTAIFSQYEPHRKLIIEEILASLARLPSSKRNLRNYRLNTEDSIQMLTALALLLVQSVIVLPTPLDAKLATSEETSNSASKDVVDPSTSGLTEEQKMDDEVLVINSYRNALRTAHTFLLVFLRKSTVKGEDDYRMIFENFVNDLLLAVNKPEWPAAEVMLSLLGSLLVQQFNNKSLDQSVRVASVDYLGTVASTLRRDAVTSQLKENDIDAVIRDLLEENHSDDDDQDNDVKDAHNDGEEKVKVEDRNGDINGESESHPDHFQQPDITPEDEATLRQGQPRRKNKTENSVSAENDGSYPSEQIENASESRGNSKDSKKNKKKPTKRSQVIDPIAQLDRVQALRDAVLDYLAAEDASPTAVYARRFYLAQWLHDCTKETERAQQTAVARKGENQENGLSESTGISTKLSTEDYELVLSISERRRQHILYKIREPPDTWRQRRRFWSTFLPPRPGRHGTKHTEAQPNSLVFHGTLDYEDGCLVCRYLASLRPFSQSFDVYLSQICKLVSESSVPVRTKALRCLSAVVEADPDVLARVDIERAVHSRLLDTSTSVREAAVDLLGRFLGRKPELTAQYYPMLAERILDKGVSVRKRVIRILRDICLEQPDFPRVAEICVKMIRRVNDEEGIKKLVNEVFQTMWFSPVRDKETVKLLRKVMNITDVVAACKDTGFEWFEQFLRSLLKKEEDEKVKPVEKACKQIVDCLVQYIMRLEEISGQSNQRLVACLATLHLLTKVRPELMVEYAMFLQTYLRCNETSDPHVLHYVARILEVTVPLMEHPSETFIAQLEEDMVRLTLRHGKMVLESCVACLGSVVNRVSKNYTLARDCFTRLFNALQRSRAELADDPDRKISPTIRPSILRALFTVGLLCKHFDANMFQSSTNTNVRDQVFDLLMFFTEQVKSDIELRKKALAGLGFLSTRHHELLCETKLRDFYHRLLQTSDMHRIASDDSTKTSPDHQLEFKCIVLENLLNFFLEEEKRMLDADSKWKARHQHESLKEMGDVASGMGSFVAQTYLRDTLETFFSPVPTVRLTALSVVSTILRQGLIHPVQTVPYLIAVQTDLDQNVRVKADAQLQEIDHKFPGFLSMRAIQGVSFSYRLQFVLYPELIHLIAQKAKLAPASCSSQVLSPDNQNTSGSTTKHASHQSARRSARHKGSTAASNIDGENCDMNSSGCLEETAKSSKVLSDLSEQLPGVADYAEGSFECIRGTRDPLSDIPTALNSNLYSMLRGNRGQRRSLLSGLISLFDDSQANSKRVHLSQLIYVADNLAHFSYQCQEEPLFVIHHIDLMVSMSGSGVLQSVRETLFPELKAALEAALAAQAEAEMRNRAQAELQLRTEIQALQAASAEALNRSDHLAAEQHAEQLQATINKLNSLIASNPPYYCGGSSMSELRSAALVGRESIPHMDLGPLEEEEEDAQALLSRLESSRETALPIMRDAIRTSRACVLLLTLKQYLKEVYSITDAKIQRYSPTDSAKLWERPLTRRAGVRFQPGPCLQAAGVELRKLMQVTSMQYAEQQSDCDAKAIPPDWPPILDAAEDSRGEEAYEGEMRSLVHDYLDFRKLILTIDPPGDDDLVVGDDLNTSMLSQSAADQPPTQALPARLRPVRTVVPQSHDKSSEEENDSEDSNAGGASRLMLAQSAPNKRRKPGSSLRPGAPPTRNSSIRPSKKRRKRKRRYVAHGSSSGEDSDSLGDSEASDPDY
ncbi:Nipped-B-like protein B [Clonorchis sinensis]|uniref:Nipped-B protein n=1 Tax=Clonorchis sinensis TaxID=79923 RepID=A0A8T1M3K8_CLOSI|nr:Nipped-B-like protein B [Clonorchis sinensis]